MDWAEEELQTINMGDKRIDRRAKQLLSRLGSKPTISIPAACNGWPETKAAYRLLDNGAVTAESILEPHRDCTLNRLAGEDIVLCIEDTSELDYKRTLQRRLVEEETNYKALLNQVREELARHYLTNSALSSNQISFLLGYDDPNSFFRAFHSWTGRTPESVRLELFH